jgi:hypothetical protein
MEKSSRLARHERAFRLAGSKLKGESNGLMATGRGKRRAILQVVDLSSRFANAPVTRWHTCERSGEVEDVEEVEK